MRRFLVVLSLVALSFGAFPEPASTQGRYRGVCEGYCGAITLGCYVFLGLFVRDKCGSFYEGCVDGCVAVLLEPDLEEGES